MVLATAADGALGRDPAVDSSWLYEGFLSKLAVDGASVSVVTSAGSHSTVSSSGALSTRLDQLQFDLGEGPHWWALETRKPVLVSDVRAADHSRWPMFGNAIVGSEARGVFAFPLTLGAATVGVVDLYRRAPGALTAAEVGRGEALARALAGRAVAYATADADGDGRRDTALVPGTRRVVHQATGMVSVQLNTSVTDAFSRLRGYAYLTGRDLNDVATDVVARVLDFADLPDSDWLA